MISRRPSGRRTSGFLLPVVLGIFGSTVSFAWSWQPSYWGDEAASVVSAERSLASLFRLLGHIDAVHGVYYVFLHFWIELFGASEVSTRLPSALAIGAATAGTFVLTRMVLSRGTAVVAAAVFAILPRVTYMGAESRSTALATMLAVWTMIVLLALLHPRTSPTPTFRMFWVGYAAVLAAGFAVFLYLVLLIPVHLLVVLLMTPAGPNRNRALRRWAAATAGGLLIASPILYWGLQQREQISFLARRPQVDVLTAAVDQWFLGAPLAAVAWALILIALLVTVARWRRRMFAARSRAAVLGVALTWMLLPSTVLLIGTHLIAPMYSLRYLSICTPAVAVAMAMGVVALHRRRYQGAALALIAAAFLPTYIAQRGDFAKNGGSDLRQVADVLRVQARPGDAVVFDESTLPSRRPRLALHLYPDAFTGLVDITLLQSYRETDSLWDTTVPLVSGLPGLSATSRVWLCELSGSPTASSEADVKTLQEYGFSVGKTILVNRTGIIEMTR